MKLKLFVVLLLTSYAAFSMTRVTTQGIRATVFTNEELKDMQTPYEVFPEDLEEKCGNCCWQGVDDGCPIGCSCSSLALGFMNYGVYSRITSALLSSGIFGAQCMARAQEAGQTFGLFAAACGVGAISLIAADLGDYAGEREKTRLKKYQEYLQTIEKLSPEDRAKHIKECLQERAHLKELLAKKNN